jgi:GT2 family glycosyltransferase
LNKEELVLSVLLVNYNDRENLSRCLSSLKCQIKGIPYEIIVVDNNSSDGSQEFVRENHPDVNLIINEKNVGFSRANNRGLQECRGEYTLLQNTDTVVLPGAIEILIKALQSNPGLGAVGPALLQEEDTFQVSFGRRVSFLPELLQKGFLNQFYRSWLRISRKPHTVGWLSAACLLVPYSVLQEVGFFDENFFLYFEDIDLCVRIKKSGYDLLFQPLARVIHVGGAATAKTKWLSRFNYRKSQLYFYRKHNSKASNFMLRFYLGLIFRLSILLARLRGAGDLEERRKFIRLLREQ